MDRTTWGFLLGIIIDICVMTVMILVFCFFKKYRTNPDTLANYNVFLKENSLTFKDLILRIYSADLKDIKQVCGTDSHNYLYLNKILAIYTSIVGLYTVIILLPIYNLGSDDPNNMHNLGFNNIIDHSDLLVAPMLIFILNSLFFYYILKLYVVETQKNHADTSKNFYAVRVLGFPVNHTTASLKKKIEECLSGESFSVYVVPNLCDALKYEALLKEAKNELMHYLDAEKSSGFREKIRINWYKYEKHDAIHYWEDKLENFKQNYEKEIEKSKSTNSGVCILTSSSKIYDYSKINRKLIREFPLVKISSLVKPEDIIWENISIDQNASRGSHICYTVFFFYLFVVLLTPVTFLSFVYKFLDGIGVSEALVGFLTIYSPEILMLLYQVVIVPGTVSFLVKHERHYSKSHQIISALNKYLLFFLFNVLFIPAIGMQAVSIVESLVDIDSFNEWSEDMVSRINSTSILFMSLIITQAFIINARDLLQLGKLIMSKYYYFRAVSEREKYNAFLPVPMNYSNDYAVLLTYFTAILIFSISYPLILLFGAVYLWTKVKFM